MGPEADMHVNAKKVISEQDSQSPLPCCTDLHIYYFCRCSFIVFWYKKNLPKTTDSLYVGYVEYTSKLRTVAMFVIDLQTILHKGCISICL